MLRSKGTMLALPCFIFFAKKDITFVSVIMSPALEHKPPEAAVPLSVQSCLPGAPTSI